jgi:hypothetical protein
MPKKGHKQSKQVSFSTFIGIDPGVSGGLAVILSTSEIFLRETPDTNIALLDWMLQWRNMKAVAVIESLVGYRPRSADGMVGGDHPSSRMQQYGRSYGRLEVAVAAAGIGLDEVSPQKWQRHFDIPKRAKDESRDDFKRRLKERAATLYPHLKGRITLANCDALLLARYCKDTYGG